jgi:hypothetical protein
MAIGEMGAGEVPDISDGTSLSQFKPKTNKTAEPAATGKKYALQASPLLPRRQLFQLKSFGCLRGDAYVFYEWTQKLPHCDKCNLSDGRSATYADPLIIASDGIVCIKSKSQFPLPRLP